MADNFTVFSTGTFHFKLGQPPQSIHLHTKLVAKHSPFLGKLMTGPMREAQDGTATIHDVEVDSFTRFAEYIYGGDYDVVQPIVEIEVPEVPQDDCVIEEQPVEDSDWASTSKSKKKKGARKAIPRQVLLSLADYSVVSPITAEFPVLSGKVLFCHARVYSMADRFQVSKLKELAVYKIYRVLCQIIDHDHCYMSNLVSLLDYVYGHTMDLESTKEPLRDLLAHYVAWNFRSCMEEEDFKAYLAKNGAFAQDVCEKVSMRL